MTAKSLKLFDNTRINAFRTCPRYYLFAHVYHWKPEGTSAPLVFGSSWHSLLDTIWADIPSAIGDKSRRRDLVDRAMTAFTVTWVEGGMPHPDELGPDELEQLSPRTPQIAREMAFGYLDERQHIFSDPSFKVLAIEQPFAVPLSPTDPSLFYVGRMDKVFEYRKDVYVGEAKTTTAFKKNGPFRADWVDQWNVSAQLDGYIYALRSQYKERAKGVWIDGALVHKLDHSGFRFLPETRSDAQLDSWLWETLNYVDQISGNLAALAERRDDATPYLAAFPRNTNSCVQYGRCAYLDLCRVIANPEEQRRKGVPLGYKVELWSPFDVLHLEKLGFTIESAGEPVKSKGEQP